MTVPPHRQPSVVAIDASDDIRRLYHELLRDEGYSVETLACHQASRDVLRELRPDIVLLDCFIGCDPSGWELLQLLSLDIDLQRVPVAICTTDARMFSDESRASLADDIQMLPKPFDVQELLSVLAAALMAAQATTSE